MRIILEPGSGEVFEKKSRFIASIQIVHTQEEAVIFVEQMKKKYYDARHSCYAYIIGKNAKIVKCSDDGEPAQTAGKPILDVLLHEELSDVICVVTRYFGGTLLGTGGLIRAYSEAAKQALSNCVIGELKEGFLLDVSVVYNDVGKLQYYFNKERITVIDAKYEENVFFHIQFDKDHLQNICDSLTEITNGRAIVGKPMECTFIDKNEPV